MTSAEHLTKITANDVGDFNVPHNPFYKKTKQNFSMSQHYIHNIEIFCFNFTNKMQHNIKANESNTWFSNLFTTKEKN